MRCLVFPPPSYFKDVNQEIHELRETVESTENSLKELGCKYEVIDQVKLLKKCDDLQTHWQKIQGVIPERISVVNEELDGWIQYDEKLQQFKSWLSEVEEMCEDWKTHENSDRLIKNLEVF